MEAKGLTFVPISAATRQGVDALPAMVYSRLKELLEFFYLFGGCDITLVPQNNLRAGSQICGDALQLVDDLLKVLLGVAALAAGNIQMCIRDRVITCTQLF